MNKDSNVKTYFYPEHNAGGFTRVDGTVEFYTRVNSLLNRDMVVVDFGAGRGSGSEDTVEFKRKLRTLKNKVKKVIGVDVDPAIKKNPLIDEAIVFSAGSDLPLPDSSVDLIISDAVFEHLEHPEQIAKEFGRVLKPGGWICARTPNRWGYVGIGTNLIPNQLHVFLLRYLQPNRKVEDIFPTYYRLNTKGQIKSYFPSSLYDNFTYTWNAEPAYFANFKPMWYLMFCVFKICPEACGAFLFVFLRAKNKNHIPEDA